MNVGLETRQWKYITELLNIGCRNPGAEGVRRDLRYLIDQLAEGERKREYERLFQSIYK